MHPDMSLGELLRCTRIAKGSSLRGFADILDITPSYLSDIENDRRVPAEDVLQRFAIELNISFDELMIKAGRFGEVAERYLRRKPDAVRLFRRISEADLPADELRKLIDEIPDRARPEEQ
jgi:HTH-type transcriptional regulator, competence development regulator